MIEIVEMDSFDKLAPYKEQWNRLLEKNRTNVVFLTYEFCQTHWETLGTGAKLLVLIAKHGSEVVGIAPLAINTRRRFGRSTRILEFVVAWHADYADFILGADREAVLSAIYSYLWSIRDRWDIARFKEIPEASPTIEQSNSLLGSLHMPFAIVDAHGCPMIRLEGHGEEAIRKAFRRHSSLRNSINRLKRMGELTYGHADTLEEGFAYLDLLFHHHICRWEHTVTLSKFYYEHERAFFRSVVKSLLPRGWLRIAYLNLDEKPIALYLGFEYNGSLSYHTPAYDPMYSKYSPGRVMVYYALQYCMERGLRDFDLMRGIEQYKVSMANLITQSRTLCIYKSGLQRYAYNLKSNAKKTRLLAPWYGDSKILRFRQRVAKRLRLFRTWGYVKLMVHRVTSGIVDYSSNRVYVWRGERLVQQAARCPLDIRTGDEADLPLIAAFHGWPPNHPTLERFKAKLARGNRLYLAFNKKVLVHTHWASRGPIVDGTEVWGHWQLGDDDAWILDGRTSYIFRRSGIEAVVLQRMMTDLAEEGVHRIFLCISRSNVPSIRAATKAGFRSVKDIRALRLFGRKVGRKTITTRSLLK